jgi:hypothetical protein
MRCRGCNIDAGQQTVKQVRFERIKLGDKCWKPPPRILECMAECSNEGAAVRLYDSDGRNLIESCQRSQRFRAVALVARDAAVGEMAAIRWQSRGDLASSQGWSQKLGAGGLTD